VSTMELQMLLNSGESLFATLELETLYCLKNLESMPSQQIEHFAAKRQEILDAIQKFDMALNTRLKRPGSSGEDAALEKFYQRQTFLLKRVIEADGLLLALAKIELTSLKARQDSISHGRHALNCYREEGGASQSSLKRMA